MRVGITCYPTYGGSGIVATELGLELARRGHEIHFISYSSPIRLNTSIRGIHYHEVEVSNYPLFAYPPYVMALASRMAEIAERHRLDLLHVHYAIPHSIAAYLARAMTRLSKLPFITTLHGTDITIVGADPAYFRATQFGIQQSDAITTISAFMQERTEQFFGISKPIEVIHNFVNCAIYKPRIGDTPENDGQLAAPVGDSPEFRATQPNGDSPLPTIVHISNFRPVKRVLDCIRVFHQVRKHLDCRLLMAGEGPDRGPAEQLAVDLGVFDHVQFLGKTDSIERLLPGTDVLHLPSETEAFGLAALEAMACGVPPVATNTGGLPELITQGQDGFLEAVGDIPAQTNRIVELLTNPALHQGLSRSARQTAVTRFSSELIIPRYEAVYRQVCGESSGELSPSLRSPSQ